MARIVDGLFKGKMTEWVFSDIPSDYLAYGWKPELDSLVDSDNVINRLLAVKKHYALEVLCKDPDWRVRLAVVRLGYLNGNLNDPSARVQKAIDEYRLTRVINSKKEYVMSEKFAEIRKQLLSEYAQALDLPVGGTYNNNGKHYDHILKYDKGKKIETIEKNNLLQDLRFDGFIPEKKVHRLAHHLNSSQVLCYNYFRPMLNDDHTPKQNLIALMKEHGIIISGKARCDFEYDGYRDYKDEGTEFDFHIADGDIEVYFEIKYTEDGFGSAKKDDRHKDKFECVYRNMLKKCQCLKNNDVKYEDFIKDYQLYRNVIRITGKNNYTIFITAKGNAKTYTQLNSFLLNIKNEYKNNVIALYWEDLIDERHPLFQKYIAV